MLGAEQIAGGDLATAVGDRASLTIKVQPLDQLPMPDSISDTVEDAIDRALSQRPDLMQQVAEIRSANARVQEAHSAYFPVLNFHTSPSGQSLGYPFESQRQLVIEVPLLDDQRLGQIAVAFWRPVAARLPPYMATRYSKVG